jgi:uncharacterized membrane protein YoaK (UPF0700 family)
MSKSVSVKTPTPLIHLLLLLSATTGMVDAASILGMGQVFTANMTGNVVFLAFSAAGAPGYQPWPYIIALGFFILGAACAGRLWRMPGPQPLKHWLIMAASIEASVLLLSGFVALSIGRSALPEQIIVWIAVALTSAAMGFRNAVIRQIQVPDLTTTVLTLTITGIASDAHVASGQTPNLGRRFGAVAMIFSGAALGALIYLQFGLAPVLFSTSGIVFLGTLVFARHPQMTELNRK